MTGRVFGEKVTPVGRSSVGFHTFAIGRTDGPQLTADVGSMRFGPIANTSVHPRRWKTQVLTIPQAEL